MHRDGIAGGSGCKFVPMIQSISCPEEHHYFFAGNALVNVILAVVMSFPVTKSPIRVASLDPHLQEVTLLAPEMAIPMVEMDRMGGSLSVQTQPFCHEVDHFNVILRELCCPLKPLIFQSLWPLTPTQLLLSPTFLLMVFF